MTVQDQELTLQDYLDELKEIAPPDVVKIESSMVKRRQTRHVSVDIDPDDVYKSVEIMMLTDVQYGHLDFNRDRFIEYRDWLLSKPNRFCVFGGDMIDAATLTSGGKAYENRGTPLDQTFEFCKLAIPLRHRVLGYVGGNHERHGYPSLGGSIGQLIATMMRIPYSDGQQFIDIQYGAWEPFKISLWHGTGGSRTPGAQMNVLSRFMQQGDSHLYLMGHLHCAMVRPAWRIKRGYRGQPVGLEKYYGIISSSFLDYWGTYSEIVGFNPSETMMGRVILEPNQHMEVTLR